MDNNLAMEPRRESGKFSRAMRAVVAVVLAMVMAVSACAMFSVHTAKATFIDMGKNKPMVVTVDDPMLPLLPTMPLLGLTYQTLFNSAIEAGRTVRHTAEVLPVLPLAAIPGPVQVWVGAPLMGWKLQNLNLALLLPVTAASYGFSMFYVGAMGIKSLVDAPDETQTLFTEDIGEMTVEEYRAESATTEPTNVKDAVVKTINDTIVDIADAMPAIQTNETDATVE